MPPKRGSARAQPASKAPKSRTAAKETTSAADRTKMAPAKKSKISAAAAPTSRKRGRSPNTGISSAKASKAPGPLQPNAPQLPPTARRPRDRAGSGKGEASSSRARQAAAHPPQPPLKTARTQPLKSASTHAAVPRPEATDAVVEATTEAMEGDGSHNSGATSWDHPEGLSLLRRYLPFPAPMPTDRSSASDAPEWSTTDAAVFSMFLAEAQAHLIRHCCRQLAQLTTSTAPAFLHAAALGEAALAASHPLSMPTKASSGSADQDSLPPVDPLIDRQELTYRTLRATVAASCTLGHRSCQVLWGPRGSGKHRILRLLAQDVRSTPNTLVIELQGRLLRDDEAALGVIAEQLLSFLRGPQSAQLRAAHYLLRTGTFEFGQVFRFEQRMQDNEPPATAQGLTTRAMHGRDTLPPQASRRMGGSSVRNGQGGAHRYSRPSTTTTAPPTKASHGRARGTRWNASRRAARARADSDTEVWDEDTEDDACADEDDDVQGGSSVMVTSTTAYLTGGAASALPHLQRALLLLKSQGCSIVVCIRDIDVFGIRCDQLLYVLAGLMHDSDGSGNGAGSGGGLSLLLASAAPDIRQLEKRLSSRLTCETRYVPLLPWSLRNLLAATLHTTAQDALNQVRMREVEHQRGVLVEALRTESARRQHSTDGGGGRATYREKALLEKTMTGLQTRLHASDATLRELRAQRRHLCSLFDTEAAAPARTNHKIGSRTLGHYTASGWRSSVFTSLLPPQNQVSAPTSSAAPPSTAVRTWSVSSLFAHPSLTLEVQCVMCEELLRQLSSATRERVTRGLAGADDLRGHDSSPLAPLVTELSTELELSSSSSTVLAVLASHLCKAASGSIDFLGRGGRRVLFSWLRARLQHEPIPTAAVNATSASEASAAHPGGVPQTVLSRWQEAAAASTALRTSESGAGRVEKTPLSERATDVRFESTLNSGDDGPAARDVANGSRAVYHRTRPELPSLSLLPPHIHDLLADGQLVGMGYGSREVLLVLFYMHIHHTNGVRQRTVSDLLEDVSSSLGTKAAAALDREAFRIAIRHLCRWRLLRVVEVHSQLLEMCGNDARLRDFLFSLLSKKQKWCEAELGLDAREMMRFRNLL
ncbi:hypothetical protein JKF63_06558 [Porcisia hertigi]|uniref:Origin recognition complex subunit 4 n=1 Tax=Porcisia hertigi TaxID=2761500 RepID=A0A836IDV6_9TRYP|nr:hypothetical protein JKF63_06558 [Porcisia hertigi]